MAHPQDFTQSAGRQRATRLVERDGTVVSRDLVNQPLQPCGLTRVGRFTADCAAHGRFLIDEYELAPVCPGAGWR